MSKNRKTIEVNAVFYNPNCGLTEDEFLDKENEKLRKAGINDRMYVKTPECLACEYVSVDFTLNENGCGLVDERDKFPSEEKK